MSLAASQASCTFTAPRLDRGGNPIPHKAVRWARMQPLHLAALHRPSVKVAELLLAAAPPSSHSALCVHQLLGRSAGGRAGRW